MWGRAVIGLSGLAVATACSAGDGGSPGQMVPTAGSSLAVAPPPVPSATPTPPAGTAPVTPADTAPLTRPTTTPAAPATTPTTVTDAPGAPTVDTLLASGRVLNIAHAGGDQDHPHSTRYAYRQAVAAGADVLEMDVQLTADGVLIVQHDADTSATTEAALVVADSDLAALQALDGAYWFSPQCWPCHDLPDDAYPFRGMRTGVVPPPPGFTPDDFRIMTLRELAAAFPDLPFDIEIKGTGVAGLAVAEALAAELVALDRVDTSVVASFESDVIQAFHALAPEVAVSPGVAELAAWMLGGGELADHYRIVQVPPFYDDLEVLTPEHLAIAEQAGVALWVWPNDAATQENEGYYRHLVELGVDGIIAGRPAAAAAAIG